MEIIKADEIEPDVRHVNYCSVARGSSWGPRRISDFEMLLVLSGCFEFTNHETGEHVVQEPGTLLVIYPDELHTYRLDPASRKEGFFSCIHLELRKDINRKKNPLRPHPFPRRLTNCLKDSTIQELFKKAEYENTCGGTYRDALLSLIVKEIWLRLSGKWAAPEEPGHSARLAEMIEFLRSKRLSHPGRAELAARFHLSPQHINLIFRRETGMSPVTFLHKELMRDAYNMLLIEQLSVKETADRLGFANQFYFSRVFKKIMGFPPALRR